LAGVPAKVLKRAKEILKNIESGELDGAGKPVLAHSNSSADKDSNVQLSLFKSSGEILINSLKKLDLSSMTPLEALNELNALKELLEDE
jgi:DNA mismatch repair protein MutS